MLLKKLKAPVIMMSIIIIIIIIIKAICKAQN